MLFIFEVVPAVLTAFFSLGKFIESVTVGPTERSFAVHLALFPIAFVNSPVFPFLKCFYNDSLHKSPFHSFHPARIRLRRWTRL